jgi:signal transduction histidine kinase
VFLLLVVLFVAGLATIVSAIATGNAPRPGVTIGVTVAVLIGLGASARYLWRNARTIGALMDAADRVSDGDLAARVPAGQARQLSRLTGAFNAMAEHLETNERRRRELLADVAHELRTPLQVIRGSAEGMLDGLYPVDAERLRLMLDETDVMARLLDDLRTLSMAEAGVLQLHREPVDPAGCAEDAVAAFGATAAGAGVSLTVERDPAAPSTIEADPVRLAEVLANLVTNALRHTPSGGSVIVRVGPASRGVTFAVEDTGPGIDPDLLPTVFDRFTGSDHPDGTGLGLAIAKRLVEAHGGTIAATRGERGGTSIRFTLP